MRIWDDVLSTRDREVYSAVHMEAAGISPGSRPALIVVDVTQGYLGDKPEPIMESIKRFPISCGEDGWNALKKIEQILAAARESKLPIVYTGNATDKDAVNLPKVGRRPETRNLMLGIEFIPKEIAPHPEDTLISKSKPSAFFGTVLASWMTMRQVDTLIVTGCITSGCVRATVEDAYNYNLRVLVAEDGVFDRGEAAHKLNLHDMHEKYAQVLPASAICEYLRSLPRVSQSEAKHAPPATLARSR